MVLRLEKSFQKEKIKIEAIKEDITLTLSLHELGPFIKLVYNMHYWRTWWIWRKFQKIGDKEYLCVWVLLYSWRKNILIMASLWDSPILDGKFVQENKRHENVYNDTPNSLSRKISQRMKCAEIISMDISIAFFLIVKKI